LNRIVVAACSPRMHEPTFRSCIKAAGLNQYLLEMANIREHCSWVHLHDKSQTTEKAKDLVCMSVARARLLQPQEELDIPVIQKALVIGGGVAGIQATLDLADSQYQVILVEKEPSIGGRMAQIDKTFPTMDCSICILAPKMAEAGRHPRIKLMSMTEVTNISGYVCSFTVSVRHRGRHVTADCTSCGECSKVCPRFAPNEFDIGLATRGAIYLPFAQAVPATYLIDMDLCLNKDGVRVCEKCVEACERKCIGSRSSKTNPYCSNVCCMNTIKDSLLIKEHWPDTQIAVFYIDIRTFGKGFEDLFQRAKQAGVQFIHGLPGEVIPLKNGNLRLVGESTLLSKLYDIEVDMVILSVGLKPSTGSDLVRRFLTLSLTSGGFFMVAHPKLRPVDTSTRGVFLAGCAEGPKDIKDSLTQASAAAARANIIMRRGKVTVEAITARVDQDACTGCGSCTKVCPYQAIYLDENKKAVVVGAACSGCGTCGAECAFGAITMRHFTDEQILAQVDAFTEYESDRKILAFNCNWCSYAGADFAGVSRMQYPTEVRIIRTMCSGRVSTRFVERAFARGVAMVLISGCSLSG